MRAATLALLALLALLLLTAVGPRVGSATADRGACRLPRETSSLRLPAGVTVTTACGARGVRKLGQGGR
jgi:hypothetical protein